jgi:hypothetical protein
MRRFPMTGVIREWERVWSIISGSLILSAACGVEDKARHPEELGLDRRRGIRRASERGLGPETGHPRTRISSSQRRNDDGSIAR